MMTHRTSGEHSLFAASLMATLVVVMAACSYGFTARGGGGVTRIGGESARGSSAFAGAGPGSLRVGTAVTSDSAGTALSLGVELAWPDAGSSALGFRAGTLAGLEVSSPDDDHGARVGGNAAAFWKILDGRTEVTTFGSTGYSYQRKRHMVGLALQVDAGYRFASASDGIAVGALLLLEYHFERIEKAD